MNFIFYSYWLVLNRGIFENVLVKFLCLINAILNLAFMAGSSNDGKARRASVGSN